MLCTDSVFVVCVCVHACVCVCVHSMEWDFAMLMLI